MTEKEELQIALSALREKIVREVVTQDNMACYGKEVHEALQLSIDPLMEAQEVIYKMVEVE